MVKDSLTRTLQVYIQMFSVSHSQGGDEGLQWWPSNICHLSDARRWTL